jgi:hypothetical protein
MNKKNWNNGGCCLDAAENKALRKEWNRFKKTFYKLAKKLIKIRDAKSEEEIAHVLWDIMWGLSDDTYEYRDMILDEFGCWDEYHKIEDTHERYACKINKEMGYHLSDETGHWVK